MNFYIGTLLIFIGLIFLITDTIIGNEVITALLITFSNILGLYLIYNDKD